MNFLEKQLEDPVRFARIKRWFYGGLAVVALAEIVLPHIFLSGESFLVRGLPCLGLALRVSLLCGDHRGVKTHRKAVAHAPRGPL